MLRRRRSRAGRREDELPLLVRNDDSQSYTNMTDQDPEQDQSGGSSTEEAGPSTGSNQKLRLMVLGGDDDLMDKACGTILRKIKKEAAFEFGKLEPMNADACGRQVSVLKTPFAWLEHLKSYLFFNWRVKAIRKEMESFESKMFPGPHAFLLVHRDVKNSGREYYILHALSDVFGKKVLDYCMVLFMDEARHNNPKKNKCLKICGSRYHILHNTDNSVNTLFEKILTMPHSKDRSFFTNHFECFSKASNYFQVEYVEKEDKLRKELNDSKNRENQLKELNDSQMREEFNTSTHHDKQLNEELIVYKDRERQLRKELNDSRDREDRLRKELHGSRDREDQSRKELNDSRDREDQSRKELKDSRDREDRLRKELHGSRDREDKSRKELNGSRDREDRLRDNIKQLEEFKEQLENNLADARVKEDCVHERERNLHIREKQLDDREKDLEIREREVRSREHHQTTADPAVSRDKSRPLDEREEELKSRDDSQASGLLGIQKPVRRNSMELQPPNMSETL